MNSVNPEDKKILTEVIWASSNISAGTQEQVDSMILQSNLPKIIFQINKFKKDNKVI